MRRGPCSAKPAVCALRRARVKSSVSCAVPPLEEAAHPPASAACAALATPARLPHPRGTAAAPHPHSALAAVPRSRSDPRLNAPPVRSTWTSTSGATCAARLPGSRRPHAVGCCPSTAGSSIPTMRPRRSRGAPRPQPGPHGRHAWPARPTRQRHSRRRPSARLRPGHALACRLGLVTRSSPTAGLAPTKTRTTPICCAVTVRRHLSSMPSTQPGRKRAHRLPRPFRCCALHQRSPGWRASSAASPSTCFTTRKLPNGCCGTL